MKLFQNKSLASRAAFSLVGLVLVLVVELFLIRSKVEAVEKFHYQRDFARKTQASGQQFFVNAILTMQGNQGMSAQLVSEMDRQEHSMKTLSDGGRIEGTSIFIPRLQKLPRISFDELQAHWTTFSEIAHRTLFDDPISSQPRDLKLMQAHWLSISSWFDQLIKDLDKLIDQERYALNVWIILIGIFDMILIFVTYLLFRQNVLSSLNKLELNTSHHAHTLELPPNEIGAVARHVNGIIEQLKDASDFVQGIGKGNLDIRYEELDKTYKPGKNKLADSLIDMQSKLSDLNEEDHRRQWVNEGLTKFVDILRSGGDNIKSLGDSIISTLVKYTASNQGSLYILNDAQAGNPYLELISMFAFDVKKFENRRIKIGEGIVGQVFLEKEVTYLKNIPPEYIRITSGLGDANPSSILVVPLKIDQDVFGIIELASFNDFQGHEISFVERLGETIASTFATVKAAQRNRELLDEAKSATEMMRSQEEEMRQNMEELQATQEEMARKERDYIARIEDLEKELAGRGSGEENSTLKEELALLKHEKENLTRTLEEVRRKPGTSDEEWAVAAEVEKTLKINLEAIKIMREEFDRKNRP